MVIFNCYNISMEIFSKLKSLNVLYVDDEKDARDSLSQILKYYFNEVFLASNGIEALEIYNKNSCHLLLVDYDMPIMNGNDFLKEIRKDDKRTPAVIVSSYEDKEKLKSAIKLGLVDYLVKPYEMHQLKVLLLDCIKWMEDHGTLKFFLTDEISYSFTDKSLMIKDKPVALTAYESKIIELFISNENKLVTYDVIMYTLDESTTQKSMFTIVYKLKKKIGADVIKNVKDLGYILSRL